MAVTPALPPRRSGGGGWVPRPRLRAEHLHGGAWPCVRPGEPGGRRAGGRAVRAAAGRGRAAWPRLPCAGRPRRLVEAVVCRLRARRGPAATSAWSAAAGGNQRRCSAGPPRPPEARCRALLALFLDCKLRGKVGPNKGF